jgi:copper chaperone CopZ
MRNFILVVVFLLTINSVQSQILKAELIANGLTCSMCSNATMQQLETLSFIDSIATDLDHTTFLLFFKKEKEVNIDLIRKKVEDAGFSVGSLILYVYLTNQKVENGLSFSINNQLFIGMNTDSHLINDIAKIKILNKSFVGSKEYKSLLKASTKYPTYKDGFDTEKRQLFHIKLL